MRVKIWIVSQGAPGVLALALPLLGACSDDGGADGVTNVAGKSGVSGAPSGGMSGRGGAGGSMNSGGSVSSGGSGGTTAPTGGTSTGGRASAGTAGASGGSTSGGSTSGGSTSGGSGGASAGTAGSGGTAGQATAGASTGGSGGAVSGDAMTILAKFKPTGSTGYDTWMKKEIGTPLVASTTLASGNITASILVPEGATYDGKGQTIKPSIPGCDGSQTESQPPVFILAPGATLKNVTISPPACDGVHMMGNNTLENIVWTDVGEDAASVRSYFPGGAITIKGGSARSADDKVFQFNAPVQVTITDFKATNISKMVRQNGGTSFAMSVDLKNVTVSGCGEAVVRGSSNCVVRAENVTHDCPALKRAD